LAERQFGDRPATTRIGAAMKPPLLLVILASTDVLANVRLGFLRRPLSETTVDVR
jgi:hypothetical protein